jgi:adenylate kinase family enzyme
MQRQVEGRGQYPIKSLKTSTTFIYPLVRVSTLSTLFLPSPPFIQSHLDTINYPLYLHCYSLGDVLRSHVRDKTPLGVEAKTYMDKGDLVPDQLMVDLVQVEIKKQATNRILLDGFPRTLPQAKALLATFRVDAVLALDIPRETIVARISNRWTHLPSGRVYAYDYNPPKVTHYYHIYSL